MATSKVRSSNQVFIDDDLDMRVHKIKQLTAGTATGHGVEYDQMGTAIGAAVNPILATIHAPTADLTAAKAVASAARANAQTMLIETLGLFWYDADNAAASNDDTIIRPGDIASDLTVGRWVRHYQTKLYQPNGTNPFVYTDNSGQLHIDGNIIQSGSAYITHAEHVYTTKDLIILREGATASLAVGAFAGFQAIKYDGVNDGYLVFDKDGTARVGDVGSQQPLTTRIETPTNGYYALWDSANLRLNFAAAGLAAIGLGSAQYQIPVTGATTFTPGWTTAANLLGASGLNALTYASASFVKMTAANTFALRTIAETLSDIGATSGTGTTSYLPKWTSSSILGNSRIKDNGTDFSIVGATNTFWVFTDYAGYHEIFSGTSIYTSVGGISILPNETVGKGLSLNYQGSDGHYYSALEYVNPASGTYSNLLLMKSGGNVAIGYTDPGTYKLKVNGTGYFSDSLTVSTTTGLVASLTNMGTEYAYGLAINTKGASDTSYALILRNPEETVFYGGVSTATGQVGYWGIGVTPTGTLGSRLNVNGGVSIGNGYTATAAPANGMIVQGAAAIGYSDPGTYQIKVNGTSYFAGSALISTGSHSSVTFNRGATGHMGGFYISTAGTNDWYVGTSATSVNSDYEIYNYGRAACDLKVEKSTGYTKTYRIGSTSGLIDFDGMSGSNFIQWSTPTLSTYIGGILAMSLTKALTVANAIITGTFTVNDLAGTGNRSVYVDANGKLCAGAAGSGLAGNRVYRATPSGTINGTNPTFTLTGVTIVTGSEEVFKNGMLMNSGSGNDYTIAVSNGNTIITFETGSIPNTVGATDIILVNYTPQ